MWILQQIRSLKGGTPDEAGIIPGPIMALQLMMDIALGSEEDSQNILMSSAN